MVTLPDLSGFRLFAGTAVFKALPDAAIGFSLLCSAVIAGYSVATGLSLIYSIDFLGGLPPPTLERPRLEERSGLSLFYSAVSGLDAKGSGSSAVAAIGFNLRCSADSPPAAEEGLLWRLERGGLSGVTLTVFYYCLAEPNITCLCLSMKSGAWVNRSSISS